VAAVGTWLTPYSADDAKRSSQALGMSALRHPRKMVWAMFRQLHPDPVPARVQVAPCPLFPTLWALGVHAVSATLDLPFVFSRSSAQDHCQPLGSLSSENTENEGRRIKLVGCSGTKKGGTRHATWSASVSHNWRKVQSTITGISRDHMCEGTKALVWRSQTNQSGTSCRAENIAHRHKQPRLSKLQKQPITEGRGVGNR
jgi:hypothetical protein